MSVCKSYGVDDILAFMKTIVSVEIEALRNTSRLLVMAQPPRLCVNGQKTFV